MSRTLGFLACLSLASVFLAACSSASSQSQERPAANPQAPGTAPIVSFDSSFDFKGLEARDAKPSPLPEGQGMRLELGSTQDWPGITLKPAKGSAWDLSSFRRVCVDATNVSDVPAMICLRVDNPGADGSKNCLTGKLSLAPGQSGKIVVPLSCGDFRVKGDFKIEGMHGVPGCKIDPANVVQMIVFSYKNERPAAFKLGDVVAEGSIPDKIMTVAEFIPFVDEFGQYMHADWPGKIRSDAELKASVQAQEAELAKAGDSPEGLDKFGGWEKGPQLEATGFFRVQKYDGKWWLVDPLGRLFWSNGCDSVWTSDYTPTTARESYFSVIPKEGPLAQFGGKGRWIGPPGFYKDFKSYETYNFRNANLYRKYGDDWKSAFYDSTLRRFHAWRVNTLGAWADNDLMSKGAIPFAKAIGFRSAPIEGSSGHWGKFPDPFHPEFRQAVKRCVGGIKDNPMCVGYFVNNELAWGTELSLAIAALASPETQPAKIEFVAYLKGKYSDVQALNKAWGASYASWEEMLKSDKALARGGPADPDLFAFNGMIADRYFSICNEELKKVSPNSLFLGSRFAGCNIGASVIAAAAKNCDVVSYNIYQGSVSELRLPGGLDKPVIIGEFHFGALDRGLLHEGLVPVRNQEDRGKAYSSYVEGALRNPLIVGAHWFQYCDEPVSGRPDGENYQIGLVDLCDTPYKETVDCVRETGSKMYSLRSAGR